MPTPLFLDLEQVMRLHASMIERYGGTEGTRDVGLLQSAVAMPQAAYGGEYLHGDLFEMAADGSSLRQLTEGPYDDFSPRYLPDGKILFISTRRGGFHPGRRAGGADRAGGCNHCPLLW